jgi:hypothetical protein
MKIVIPGQSKRAIRVECQNGCGCVFDVERKECKRRRVDLVAGARYDLDVKCPCCKKWSRGV